MRGLSYVVFLCVLALSIAISPSLAPGYNGGNGIPMQPGVQTFLIKIESWNLANLGSQFDKIGGGTPNLLDLALLSIQLIWIAITGFVLIVSVIVFAYPIIMAVCPVLPPAMGAIIQCVIWIATLAAIAQVVRGVPWGLNE